VHGGQPLRRLDELQQRDGLVLLVVRARLLAHAAGDPAVGLQRLRTHHRLPQRHGLYHRVRLTVLLVRAGPLPSGRFPRQLSELFRRRALRFSFDLRQRHELALHPV
jgi:hypothetical protein